MTALVLILLTVLVVTMLADLTRLHNRLDDMEERTRDDWREHDDG